MKNFLSIPEYMDIFKIKYTAFQMRARAGQVFRVRPGHTFLTPNPAADVVGAFDALPAILTVEDVCGFFGIDGLTFQQRKKIGFYRDPEDKKPIVDKMTFAEFLMRDSK